MHLTEKRQELLRWKKSINSCPPAEPGPPGPPGMIVTVPLYGIYFDVQIF